MRNRGITVGSVSYTVLYLSGNVDYTFAYVRCFHLVRLRTRVGPVDLYVYVVLISLDNTSTLIHS